MLIGESTRAVVLVEGLSDKLAVEALARRLGRDLAAEGVVVVAMGGSKNVSKHLLALRTHDRQVAVAGLYDAGEEKDVRRGLARAGFGAGASRADMERLGFYACVVDLEDELIRALDAPAVERVLAEAGSLDPFRTFQKQPQWRGRPVQAQLRRFIGAHSGLKAGLAPLLVDALDLDRVPRPLEGVLRYVSS